MVLRGSTLAPDASLQQALQDIKKAEENIRTAHDALDRAHIAVQTLESVSSSSSDSLPAPSSPSSLPAVTLSTSPVYLDVADADLQRIRSVDANLVVLLGELKRRIRSLEELQSQAQIQKQESQQTLNATLLQLACGGIAGATARTLTAPIDRVKILMQTQHITYAGQPEKYQGLLQSFRTIFQEEGFARLWRGNTANVIRVIPYSATQFASYDYFKRYLYSPDQTSVSTIQRLSAGALAGMTATSITHPLDVIRLRMSVQPELKGLADATMSCLKDGGARGLFKGYVPTVISLSPFIAINFACFDTLKTLVYPSTTRKKNPAIILGLGAASGIFAQTVCYPLDTVRRRMQMKGRVYAGTFVLSFVWLGSEWM